MSEKSYILTCSCFRMDKKAAEAFSMLYPDRILPTIVKGRDRIFKLSQELENKHIEAISKLSGKFMYYVRMIDGEIVEEVNLTNGKRIA